MVWRKVEAVEPLVSRARRDLHGLGRQGHCVETKTRHNERAVEPRTPEAGANVLHRAREPIRWSSETIRGSLTGCNLSLVVRGNEGQLDGL